MHQSPFTLPPAWHVVYWQIIGLLVAMWPLKVMMMLPSMARWRRALDIGVHVLGICVLVVIVQVRSYLVPEASATLDNLKALAGINAGINLGLKVVLAISAIKLVWDLWRMASGAPERQTGCVTVL